MASQRLSFGFEDFCKAAEVDLGMLDVSLFRIASPDPAISPEPGTKTISELEGFIQVGVR